MKQFVLALLLAIVCAVLVGLAAPYCPFPMA